MLPQASPQSVQAPVPLSDSNSSISDRPAHAPPRNTQHRNTPTNPKLLRFHVQAKRTAEQNHDQAAAEKKLRPAKVVGKPATKRQLSNKRSAEICRAAKGIYIDLLENEIVEEEQTHRDLMQKQLIQTEENTMLREKIKKLETRLALVTSGQSWLSAKGFSGASSNGNADDDADFFLGAGGEDEEIRRQRGIEWILDADLEPSHQQLDDVMDFQQSCSDEQEDNNSFHTAEDSNKTDYGDREHSSPVAIFDTAPEVPVAHFLKPNMSACSAQS